MLKLLLPLLGLTIGLTCPIGAATISDNFANEASSVEFVGQDTWIAAQFVTGAESSTLDSITLLMSVSMPGTARLDIYTNGAMGPGAAIGTLLPLSGYTAALSQTVFDGNNISLSSNSLYWVVLKASSGEFEWAWTAATTGLGTGFRSEWAATDDAGGSWFASTSDPMLMRVVTDGTVVPEPGTLAVFSTVALTAIILLIRRGRQNNLLPIVAFFLPVIASAQEAPNFFHPVTNGDGIRYPLVLSPATWNVLGPITVVPGTDGLIHLAYVMKMTNQSGSPIVIQSIETINPDDNNRATGTNKILAIKNEDVTGQVLPFLTPATLDQRNYSRSLNAGVSGAVYMDVTYRNKNDVPSRISHRITVSQTSSAGVDQTYVTTDVPIVVDRRDPIILSSPLRGPRWLNGSGCCKEITPHRWVLSPINAEIKAAEMFAIDFVQLREDFTGYKGAITELASYAYYGADIYNSAAGTVVEVVRDLSDAVPGSDPPNATAATAAGNHVIIDIGGGRYVLYAHLKPFSPTVNVGDAVQQGYVLGKLGNTGNSDAPHLHFQVMDRPSSLGAHGLPFVFDNMVREYQFPGSVDDEQNQFASGSPLSVIKPEGPVNFQNTMPLTRDLLTLR